MGKCVQSIDELLASAAERRYRAGLRGVPDGRLYLDMFGPLALEPSFGMPIFAGCEVPLSTSVQLIHEGRRLGPRGDGVCFYTADRRFSHKLSAPAAYLDLCGAYRFVVGPDFSQYTDMPAAQRRANCELNRVWEVALCRAHHNCVHNATWSLPDSYEYSVAGLTPGRPIAINSMGVVTSAERALWLRGYLYTVAALKPSKILRYGPLVEGEFCELSLYVSNGFVERMRGGRRGGA